MQLTIFGATGATGKCLVQQALAAGHDVTAVVRDSSRLAVAPQERLNVITADVMEPADITDAVQGADAVLSALGPHGSGPTSISGDSIRSIIKAMSSSGARRLITITGSVVDDTGNGFLMRRVAKPLTRHTFLRNVCSDMRHAEEQIHASRLDWTIFCPPRLTNKAGSGTYRTAIDRNLPRGVTISRADLAASILGRLVDRESLRKHVYVAN